MSEVVVGKEKDRCEELLGQTLGARQLSPGEAPSSLPQKMPRPGNLETWTRTRNLGRSVLWAEIGPQPSLSFYHISRVSVS